MRVKRGFGTDIIGNKFLPIDFFDDGAEIIIDDLCTKFNLYISVGIDVFDMLRLMEKDVPRWVYLGN